MAGAALLQIYIDAPSIQPPPTSLLDVYSQFWLGAWWLGMVIFGVVACLPALPVLAFPPCLPNLTGNGEYGEAEAEGGISCPPEPPTPNTAALANKGAYRECRCATKRNATQSNAVQRGTQNTLKWLKKMRSEVRLWVPEEPNVHQTTVLWSLLCYR
ncbi:Solute carrier organic anion transporter family member 1A6 [Taenia solium]|eukprot:TsM_001065000 transcript=TsM_001065000 gene=TsM_001065000